MRTMYHVVTWIESTDYPITVFTLSQNTLPGQTFTRRNARKSLLYLLDINYGRYEEKYFIG